MAIISGGSGNVTINGKPAGRLGDSTTGISSINGQSPGADGALSLPVFSAGADQNITGLWSFAQPLTVAGDSVLTSNSTIVWSKVSSTPTTISGYGITDAAYANGSNASGTWGISITGNANSASHVAWSGVSGTPTTLSGYGITDAASATNAVTTDGTQTITGTKTFTTNVYTVGLYVNSASSQNTVTFDRVAGPYDGIVVIDGGTNGVGAGGGVAFSAFGKTLSVLKGYIDDAVNNGVGSTTFNTFPDINTNTSIASQIWYANGAISFPAGLTSNLSISNSSITFDSSTTINLPGGAVLAQWNANGAGNGFITAGPGGSTVRIGTYNPSGDLLDLYSNTSLLYAFGNTSATFSNELIISGPRESMLMTSGNLADTYAIIENTSAPRQWAYGVGGSNAASIGASAGDFFIYDNTIGTVRLRISTSGTTTINGPFSATYYNSIVMNQSAGPLIYESDANNHTLGLRTGPSTAYKYFSFGYDGTFGVPDGGINVAGGASFGSAVTIQGQFTAANATFSTDVATGSGYRMLAGAFQSINVSLNPQTSASTAAFRAQGNFGGGYGLVDGSYGISLYSNSGNLVFAFGSNTSVTSKASINSDGSSNFSRVFSGYDSGLTNSINCSNWFRSGGATGWYNASYGGGWYMTDATYVRSYSNKAVVASDFVISSDRELKDGIDYFQDRGALIPREFVWKEGPDKGKKDFGFIAQEVEELYPEVVGELTDEDGKKIKQVSYSRLTAVLAAQLNDSNKRVTKLEADVQKLTEQVSALMQILSEKN